MPTPYGDERDRAASEPRTRRAEGDQERPKSRRGFASIDPERQREIASRGGRASQRDRSDEERREFGRRGGKAAQRERSPEERAEFGRRGGRARWENEKAQEALEQGAYRRGGRRPMGFAAMNPEQQRAIASRGGRAVPADVRSESGRRGGFASQERRTREQREAYGREGGHARWESEQAKEAVERGDYRRGGRRPIGFAAMKDDEQRAIASLGGRALARDQRVETGRRGGRARWSHRDGASEGGNPRPEGT